MMKNVHVVYDGDSPADYETMNFSLSVDDYDGESQWRTRRQDEFRKP